MEPYGVTIFTEITNLAVAHNAINLGQGFPDWDGPKFIKEAAINSMAVGGNDQYPPSPGILPLREAIAARYSPRLGRNLDPTSEITVTAGCTEALTSVFQGLVNAGEEIILIEPYYDSYPVGLSLVDAVPRYVTLRPPEFRLDLDELRAAFNPRTKAILINTPHNPTGRVFDQEELQAIADLCLEYGSIAICDEVYEDITYDKKHLHLAAFDGMADRTITLSSLGKTFSLTGWKVGWSIASEELSQGLRAAHQFLTFTTPTPVQHGAIAAMETPAFYYEDLRVSYKTKRDLLVSGLERVGILPFVPEGTYFVLADHTAVGFADDRMFCRALIEKAGVAAIPPSSFYHDSSDGANLVRFAFCKDETSISEAINRMEQYLG